MRQRLVLGVAVLALACVGLPAAAQQTAPAVLPVTSYTLPNGLKVVFHIDRSDPVVAVTLAARVGSGRELPGRTGFAHMFEHLFFLDSENLGRGGLDKLSTRVGGTGANGSTNRDWTVYNQEVPNDALEKMLWAEADKLGYFINTVTEPVLAKEKQVVKNEKRQRVDNAPYGHGFEILSAAMYPKDHPYNWMTIGSLKDLDAATLDDVKAFYRRWYTPNNTTLVVAGDFDPAQAKAWIVRYFAEIPRGEAAPLPALRPVKLSAAQSLMYEDDYAKLPMLMAAWPGPGATDRDQAILDVVTFMLAQGRDAPLNRVLIDELKLTDSVGLFHSDERIAGATVLRIRAFDGVALDRVNAGVRQAFKQFAAAGITEQALARAKAAFEVGTFETLTSVDQKALAIGRGEATTGDENFTDKELGWVRSATLAEVRRVFDTYLADRPNVALSIVPKGRPELAMTGAAKASYEIEQIVQGAEKPIDVGARPEIARSPSKIDRSVEPGFGPAPVAKVPAVWTATAANGLAVSGIEDRELPVATFAFAFDGGQRFDDPARPGAANLIAQMMTRGTAKRTAAELEAALLQLGAAITAEADRERIVLRGTTLARNYNATMALVREVLLEPRWDTAELALAKASVTAQLADRRANPQAIAERISDVATFGPDSIHSRDLRGTPASVAALTMDDLKRFWTANLAPGSARFRVAGAITQTQATAALAPLAARWPSRTAQVPPAATVPAQTAARLYFYDIPNAKQSMLMFSAPSLRRADPDYARARAANFMLGGGGFASRLTQEVREGKGYTYGVLSRVEGWGGGGRFVIGSPVRANVTLEAAQLIRDIAAKYPATFTDADLTMTKSFMAKSEAFEFEQLPDKLQLLAAIGDYGLPADFLKRDAAAVAALTVPDVQALSAKLIDTGRMTYVVVGDAATQRARLTALGLGEPVDAAPLIAPPTP